MKNIDILVGGMSCQHCVKAVTEALNEVSGVKNIQVFLDSGRVHIEYDHGLFDLKKAQQAIEDQGYDFLGVAD